MHAMANGVGDHELIVNIVKVLAQQIAAFAALDGDRRAIDEILAVCRNVNRARRVQGRWKATDKLRGGFGG